MQNIFLTYRPFHFEYVQIIITKYFPNEKNLVVHHFQTGNLNDSFKDPTGIINLPSSVFKRIKMFRQIKQFILENAKIEETINIFIPHTLGLLSNYSFYYLTDKYSNIHVNVFYEGVIFFNSYIHYFRKNLLFYLSRLCIGLFAGINYKIKPRLLDLNDKRILNIYSPFLEIDAPVKKIVKTELNKIDFIPDKGTCIIIGHRIDANEIEKTRIISSIFYEIDKLGISQIYFKDHPAERNDIFLKVADILGKKLLIIDDILPIENIVSDFRPAYIFSLWSSGILNLRQMLSPEVSIYSFVSNYMASDGVLSRTLAVFHRINIKVVYV